MQYDTGSTKVPALSRTWEATVTYRECGVVTAVRTYTVTISRLTGEYTAEIDGQPVSVLAADKLLTGAQRTLTHEVIPTPTGMRAGQTTWAGEAA